METLRKQLGETQEALTTRDIKFRQLQADFKQATSRWEEQKLALDAEIARLESENRVLKVNTNAPSAAPTLSDTENPLKWSGMEGADGDDKVPVSRSWLKETGAQLAKLTDELADKTKLCEELQNKLSRSSRAPVARVSEEEAKARWNQLRDRIKAFSLEYLNRTFAVNLVSENYKKEFTVLSPHWKSYASEQGLTCYLFRALIWRYLLRYFEVPCRAWGRDTSRRIVEVAQPLSQNVPAAEFQEFQEWYISTATLVRKCHPIDKNLIEELTTKIAEATMPLAGKLDSRAFKASLRSIVTAAAELSATFDQSHFVVLMHQEPGSTVTHGFPYNQEVMERKGMLGLGGAVDLMVTPCLLKREKDYSVIVKAEVIC
ncbi:hypothetical protein GGR51DRAFT_530144 [Nemania sp. FL0031]|nr:hypothetical protein GGR51DRAFT_530144 [Nemania sp. FL0031]